MFFAFFYTAIVFNPTETADNLKKHGGFIPGIRPGERTAEYIDYVLSRITVVGAAYLSIVCLIPELLISYAAVPFYFGGTSLLIVVSVTMDTVAQVQGYLLAHQYEGLIKRVEAAGPPAMTSELGRRIAFTVGALLVFRLGTFIPIPGIDPSVWIGDLPQPGKAGCSARRVILPAAPFTGWRSSRSASCRTSSAAIILQLMAIASPALARLRERDEYGRRRLDAYTLDLTVVLAAFQSYGIAVALEGAGTSSPIPAWVSPRDRADPDGGAVFLAWLADQITARGFGNGIALILAVGIVTELPATLAGTLVLGRQGVLSPAVILMLVAVTIVVTAFIAFVELARRRLAIDLRQPHDRRSHHRGTFGRAAAEGQHGGSGAGVAGPVAGVVADDRRSV